MRKSDWTTPLEDAPQLAGESFTDCLLLILEFLIGEG